MSKVYDHKEAFYATQARVELLGYGVANVDTKAECGHCYFCDQAKDKRSFIAQITGVTTPELSHE